MPTNAKAAVNAAASVSLQSSIDLFGNDTFSVATNFLSWGEHNFQLSTIAPTFGQEYHGNDQGGFRFQCGDTGISAFDYGLLYTAFCAMRSASVELGSSFDTEEGTTDVSEIHVAWFGNELIIYSCERNVIIPVSDYEIKKICQSGRDSRGMELADFASPKRYILEREGGNMVLSTDRSEYVCRFRIADMVRRSYPYDFAVQRNRIVDDPSTPWDETSGLGALIAEGQTSSSIETLVAEYSRTPNVESVVTRDDLVVTPSCHYQSLEQFPGSICYTDQGKIALAVNIRDKMFVYRQWFDGTNSLELQVQQNPDYTKFYDITEECKQIEAFAKTVVNVPLTVAEFDFQVFNRIKEEFFAKRLKRIPLKSAFGKMVIPEKVLLREISSDIGETVYFAVPVGIVGDNVICKNSDGLLEACSTHDWDTGYVYLEGK